MFSNSRLIIAISLLISSSIAQAQISRLAEDMQYEVEANGTVSSGDYAPLWMSANKYGLSSVDNNSGYIKAGIFRDTNADSTRTWRIGYGADFAVAANHTSTLIIHQLYADVEFMKGNLTIGAKEIPSFLKNPRLSSGGLTHGTNSRPIPQVRIQLPEYWSIPGTKQWIGFKGHLAYGAYTDGNWQKTFANNGANRYTQSSLFHSKSGFIKVGNEKAFPLTIEMGLEMEAQFGGEAWHVDKRRDDGSDFDGRHVVMGESIKDFWHAFIPGGSDVNDGDFKNVEGNQLGSWHGSIKYHGKDWSIRAYGEHFFEDHSQMFLEYGWKDIMIGIEAELPRNPFVSNVVYEFFSTKDQTGGLYHDATSALPVQISGRDNYYNHGIYGGWQHWGQANGNPLILSPIYNTNSQILFYNNRIEAHHIGIEGHPTSEWSYRLLYSNIKSWGSYADPLVNHKYGNFLLAELSYSPTRLKGWSASCTFGHNDGIIGTSNGAMLTIKKSGWIKR